MVTGALDKEYQIKCFFKVYLKKRVSAISYKKYQISIYLLKTTKLTVLCWILQVFGAVRKVIFFHSFSEKNMNPYPGVLVFYSDTSHYVSTNSQLLSICFEFDFRLQTCDKSRLLFPETEKNKNVTSLAANFIEFQF